MLDGTLGGPIAIWLSNQKLYPKSMCKTHGEPVKAGVHLCSVLLFLPLIFLHWSIYWKHRFFLLTPEKQIKLNINIFLCLKPWVSLLLVGKKGNIFLQHSLSETTCSKTIADSIPSPATHTFETCQKSNLAKSGTTSDLMPNYILAARSG